MNVKFGEIPQYITRTGWSPMKFPGWLSQSKENFMWSFIIQ